MASALLNAPLAVAKSFSPGHITGFYDRPQLQPHGALLAGSAGAGFSIERGIQTIVQVYEGRQKSYQVTINGAKVHDAEVSSWVVQRYLKLVDKNLFISVDHEVGIPIGYGLGSSGAAALSLSYALNSALGTGMSKVQAAQIAHVAEIECKTGLGTVIAEFVGGFETRLSIGGPGIGSITSKSLDGYKAVILCMSPISTRKALADISALNGIGSRMVQRLAQDGSPEEFMRLASAFATEIGLSKGRCREPIEAMARQGFLSSVALFGETVFSLVPKNEVSKAKAILGQFGGTLIVCNVDSDGAKLL